MHKQFMTEGRQSCIYQRNWRLREGRIQKDPPPLNEIKRNASCQRDDEPSSLSFTVYEAYVCSPTCAKRDIERMPLRDRTKRTVREFVYVKERVARRTRGEGTSRRRNTFRDVSFELYESTSCLFAPYTFSLSRLVSYPQ